MAFGGRKNPTQEKQIFVTVFEMAPGQSSLSSQALSLLKYSKSPLSVAVMWLINSQCGLL